MTTAPLPPELPGGQEPDPPDVPTFVRAVARLLRHLAMVPPDQPLSEDEQGRILALAAVARRLHEHLGDAP